MIDGQISSSKLSHEKASADTHKLKESPVCFERSSSSMATQRMAPPWASEPEDSSDSSFGPTSIPSQLYVAVETPQKNKLSGILTQCRAVPDKPNLLQTTSIVLEANMSSALCIVQGNNSVDDSAKVLNARASTCWQSCSRWNIHRKTNQGKCESPEKGFDGACLADLIYLLVKAFCALYIGTTVCSHHIAGMFIPLFWSIHLFTIEKLRFFKKKWTKHSFTCEGPLRSAGIRARTIPVAIPIFLAMIMFQNVGASIGFDCPEYHCNI